MSALKRLLSSTGESIAPVVMRIGLGLVILPHGLQKLFGWFGGFGFSGTMSYFTDSVGVPWILGLAAILAESLGAVLLVLGALTRLNALAIGVTMLVAMLTSHVEHGFFMNWFGNQTGEGFEFFLLAIALAASLVVTGGGRASLDRMILRLLARGRRAGLVPGSVTPRAIPRSAPTRTSSRSA